MSCSKIPNIQNGVPALVLAPMEGVTDAPMRALLTERGGFSFCVSEFLRITQDAPPVRTFYEHVPELKNDALTPSGIPVQIQLLGGDPECLAKSAQVAVSAGAKAIDLNFGCPSPTVNRHDGGATLLKYPHRVRAIVSAVREALPASIPVSAKLRLGWDDPKSIHENSEMAAQGGASWITIHGRTKIQGYIPPAYWSPIGEVRKRLGIPVVANGEIWTLDDFKRCQEETQSEHFMMGRGALANPIIPLEIANHLGILDRSKNRVSPQLEWSQIMRRFIEIGSEYTDRKGYLPCRIKQWARMAHQRSPLPWYDPIKKLNCIEDILKTVQN